MRPLVRSVTRLLAQFASGSLQCILGIKIFVAAVLLTVRSLYPSRGELSSNFTDAVSVLPYADQISVLIKRNYDNIITARVAVIRFEFRTVRKTESAYPEVYP